MTEHDIPPERDLPPGRLTELKAAVMTQIQHDTDRTDDTDHDTGVGRRVIPLGARRRGRRIGLAAAAVVAAAFGLTGMLVAGSDDPASANPNFARPTDNGWIHVHIEDLDDPEQVEQDLADLGVPAVVDIHEGGGYRCDYARSDGWVTEHPTDDWLPSPDEAGDDMFDLTVNPDALRPGETLAIEFFWDEHDGDWATMAAYRTSMSPVGECELVEAPEVIVDAERGIAGG